MTANPNNDAPVVKRPAPRDGTVGHETPGSPLPVDEPAAPAPATPIPATDSDYPRHHESAAPVTALPWLIGGVCAGLMGVCILALILLGSRNREPAAQVNNGAQPHVNTNVNRSTNQASNAQRRRDELQRQIQRQAAANRVAPNTVAPDPLTWDRDPDIVTGGDLLEVDDLDKPVSAPPDASVGAPVDEPPPTTEPAKPAAPLASLPRAMALPSRSRTGDAPLNSAPQVLTRVDVDNARDVQLQLVDSHLAGGSGRFKLVPRDVGDDSRAWEVQQSADGNPAQTVGEYHLSAGELSFAWSPEVDAENIDIAQLENQPLRIIAGDETRTIAQRIATETEPIVVKVDAGAVSVSTVIDNPPEHADLMVAMDELGDEFGEHQWEPSSTIEVGKSTDLRLGTDADPFQFALQISAEETAPGKVRIQSRPMFRHGNTRKWDYFRPREAAVALTTLQQQQATLDARLQQIQQQYRRNPVALQQATALHNQQSALLLEQVANLQRISDQCQAMQDKAQLHFRIYAKSGDEEIDLVSTTGKQPVDEAAKPTSDENIGPPIDP